MRDNIKVKIQDKVTKTDSGNPLDLKIPHRMNKKVPYKLFKNLN